MRLYRRLKNKPEVYIIYEGLEEIKNNPHIPTTQQGLKEIENNA